MIARYLIRSAFRSVTTAVHDLNAIDVDELSGIRKAEIERATLKLNEAFSILARDQEIHEN